MDCAHDQKSLEKAVKMTYGKYSIVSCNIDRFLDPKELTRQEIVDKLRRRPKKVLLYLETLIVWLTRLILRPEFVYHTRSEIKSRFRFILDSFPAFTLDDISLRSRFPDEDEETLWRFFFHRIMSPNPDQISIEDMEELERKRWIEEYGENYEEHEVYLDPESKLAESTSNLSIFFIEKVLPIVKRWFNKRGMEAFRSREEEKKESSSGRFTELSSAVSHRLFYSVHRIHARIYPVKCLVDTFFEPQPTIEDIKRILYIEPYSVHPTGDSHSYIQALIVDLTVSLTNPEATKEEKKYKIDKIRPKFMFFLDLFPKLNLIDGIRSVENPENETYKEMVMSWMYFFDFFVSRAYVQDCMEDMENKEEIGDPEEFRIRKRFYKSLAKSFIKNVLPLLENWVGARDRVVRRTLRRHLTRTDDRGISYLEGNIVDTITGYMSWGSSPKRSRVKRGGGSPKRSRVKRGGGSPKRSRVKRESRIPKRSRVKRGSRRRKTSR